MGRRTGTASQPLERKAERCAAEALGVETLGCPPPFSVTQTRENGLAAPLWTKGLWLSLHSDGHYGSTVSCHYRRFFVPLEVSCSVVEAWAFPEESLLALD